jgi:hypothetical protein
VPRGRRRRKKLCAEWEIAGLPDDVSESGGVVADIADEQEEEGE